MNNKSLEMAGQTANKAIEALANISKTTANLTDPKKNKDVKQIHKGGDTMNQPHQQTVEVHVGEQERSQPKPMIIKEKPETHIHKHFPDNRALTKDECGLEEMRIKLQFEHDGRELEYRHQKDILDRQERKEREEYERNERVRREEEQKKRRKTRGMVYGGLAAIVVAALGYSVYTDFRHRPAGGNRLEGSGGEIIETEGTVA